MIHQGRYDRDKSENEYYPLSHDLFFTRTEGCEATSYDEIDQGPIDTNLMSEIVGAKHGEAGIHIRWPCIAIRVDREIPFEFKGRRQRLIPLFQFPFQLLHKFIVDPEGALTRGYINKEGKRSVPTRMAMARSKISRMLYSLIKYRSSSEFEISVG